MGRIVGVTAADTRKRLLRAAADVFAERGYDGVRVTDIAATAGVSNGALYAHFGSKAELMVEALRERGRPLLAEAFGDDHQTITDLLVSGRWLPRRLNARSYLLAEALVAVRRDEDVRQLIRAYVCECADYLTELMLAAQAAGTLGSDLSPNALTHFCLLVATGSALITPDLHDVGDEEWATLLTRVVTSHARTVVRP